MVNTKELFEKLKTNQLEVEHGVKPQAADGLVLLATEPTEYEEISSESKNFFLHRSSDDMELEPGH